MDESTVLYNIVSFQAPYKQFLDSCIFHKRQLSMPPFCIFFSLVIQNI
jgi:hypothetical protein